MKRETKEWVLSDKYGELYYYIGSEEGAECHAMENSLIVDGETD